MKQYEIHQEKDHQWKASKVHENCYFITETCGEKDRYVAQVWDETDAATIINALNCYGRKLVGLNQKGNDHE